MKGMQDGSRYRPLISTKTRALQVALATSAFALLLGCAQSRSAWRETLGMMPSRDAEPAIPANSIAGRIQHYDLLAQQAPSMSEVEAARQAAAISQELSKDAPGPVKVAMTRCLGKLPTETVVEALAIAVHDAVEEVRMEACLALSTVDSPRAMELLAETVAQEVDVDVRLAAVRGLGRFENPRAVQALGQALDDRDPAVQFVTMDSLRKITGQKHGDDVRLWKEAVQDAGQVIASRPDRAGSRQ